MSCLIMTTRPFKELRVLQIHHKKLKPNQQPLIQSQQEVQPIKSLYNPVEPKPDPGFLEAERRVQDLGLKFQG